MVAELKKSTHGYGKRQCGSGKGVYAMHSIWSRCQTIRLIF